MSITCPNCKNVHNNCTNVFGKVCSKCGFFIQSYQDNPITKYTKNNKETNEYLKNQAINAVKKRLKGE